MDPFVQDPTMNSKPKPKIDLASFKINRASLKGTALSGLSGNWCFAIGTLLLAVVVAVLLYILISMLVGLLIGILAAILGTILPAKLVVALVVILSMLTGLITWGMMAFVIYLCVSWVFLGFVRGEDSKVSNLFQPFSNFRGRNLLAVILVQIFIFLWTLLLFIPGIIKRLSYSQTNYILKDYPELSATEAITLSREMMNGHKAELFVLELSFIGWWILSLLTFGIGLIWLIPYYLTTKTLYYDSLKKAHEAGYRQGMATAHLVIILLFVMLMVVPQFLITIIGIQANKTFKNIEREMQKAGMSSPASTWNLEGLDRESQQRFQEIERLMQEAGRE